jgi:ribosomal protein L44E
MPCSGKTAKSQLPIVGGSVRLVRKVEKQTKRPVVDFHCPTCGETKADYPNYRHDCPGERQVDYQCRRRMICSKCDRNKDGVCESLRAIQPDAPCLVSIGVAMPGVKCPDGKWQRVQFRCDKCGSVRFDSSGLDRCPQCG